MRGLVNAILFLIVVASFGVDLQAQNVYELRKLTEDEWLGMTTEDRLRTLGTAQKHERNQTFLGQFGRHYDLYNNWGYEFYEQEDRYENYAFRGYEAYNIIEERRRRWSYNEFGDRISKMRHSATIWKEVLYGDGTYEVHAPYNYINTAGSISAYVDGVWVARESTDDWAISVIGAGSLRTKFTPLTLSIPNIDGVSIDFQSANNSLKIVNSGVLGLYGGAVLASYTYNDLIRRGGVMLRGGRFRRKFGALTLGATYVNTYGVQGNRERGREWRGTVSNLTPTPMMVAVRFMDDSPEDGEGGAIVYNIRLKINGRYRDDIIPQVIMDDASRDRTSAITDKMEYTYIYPPSSVKIGNPDYDYHNVNERIPKYADYIYLNDLIKGYNSENVQEKFSKNLADSYYTLTEQAGKEIQVSGNKTVVYLFDLASFSEKMNQLEAVAMVGNDYRIQTSMIYTLETKGGHDVSGKTTKHYRSTYWRTVAQAEGNIKDNSNVRTIQFDFGFQVASIIYGMDADFNYRGFRVKAEYVTNSNNYMFPEGSPGTGKPANIIAGQPPRTGHRWSERDNAYYVTMDKDWDMFGFAGEIFKMGKFYKPYLEYMDLTEAPTFTNRLNVTNRRNGMSRIALIEDNDDDDMYPDTMLSQRTVGYKILDTMDTDGVFPGNDEDHDGIPDNNKNNNGIPDYDEPFLMFDVDPDEFIFGNDYNNNTIPDFREDDMKMDTPYDLDRQGRHFFLRFTPQRSINFIVGTFRTQGVGISNRTNNDYFKFLLDYDVFDFGKLYAEYRHEKIQDNFRDPYIQVEQSMKDEYYIEGITSTVGRFDRELYFDELEYRNSSVNRLFLDSRIKAIPSITLENHIKFERNGQIEGIMYDKTYQPKDILSTIAIVNKIVYTKRFGNWIFSPGVKFRFYKKARSESLQPLDHYLMRIPLVMFKYMISPDTDISLGMQGVPGFQFQYKDYVQSHNDYRKKTYTFQLQNRTSYFGYDVWAAAGVTLDQIRYNEAYRQYEEYKSSTTFVRIFTGW